MKMTKLLYKLLIIISFVSVFQNKVLAEKCTVLMPENEQKLILYGTEKKVKVSMAVSSIDRDIFVLLSWKDESGAIQRKKIGSGTLLANMSEAEITVDVFSSEEKVVPDGLYNIFCVKKFDLLPDEVNITPCDTQDMIALYEGERLDSSLYTINKCSNGIGSYLATGDVQSFTGGYPEKQIEDGECLCASYPDPENPNKVYHDCSKSTVKFSDTVISENEDYPIAPQDYPIPEYFEDYYQINSSRSINAHYSQPVCTPYVDKNCPEDTQITIEKQYDENKPDPPVFNLIFVNKDLFNYVIKWAIYDVSDKSLLDITQDKPNSESIEIPVELFDKSKEYKVEVKVYIKRKGCGDHYVTFLENYLDFNALCNPITKLVMNETGTYSTDDFPNERKACFKLPVDQMKDKYTVQLYSKDFMKNSFDLFYNTDGVATDDDSRANLSSYDPFQTSYSEIDSSLEEFSSDKNEEAMYATVYWATGTKESFSITPRSSFEHTITILSYNIGTDALTMPCKEIKNKICTREMFDAFKDIVVEENPGIINIQETIDQNTCNEIPKINFTCPWNEYDKYSVCCNLGVEPEQATTMITMNALEYLNTNSTKYEFVCSEYGYDCIGYNTNLYELIDNWSGYPYTICSDANSMQRIVLKEKKSGREFAIANVHPQVGLPTPLKYCIGHFDNQHHNSCRTQALSKLFNKINDSYGLPSNTIIAGDFNMGWINTNWTNCPDSILLSHSVYTQGFEHLYSTTKHDLLQRNIDHLFSNLSNLSYECRTVKANTYYGIKIFHSGILCEFY